MQPPPSELQASTWARKHCPSSEHSAIMELHGETRGHSRFPSLSAAIVSAKECDMAGLAMVLECAAKSPTV